MNNKQTILAITGSDGTGGSGIQADIRCISELGGTVTFKGIERALYEFYFRQNHVAYVGLKSS